MARVLAGCLGRFSAMFVGDYYLPPPPSFLPLHPFFYSVSPSLLVSLPLPSITLFPLSSLSPPLPPSLSSLSLFLLPLLSPVMNGFLLFGPRLFELHALHRTPFSVARSFPSKTSSEFPSSHRNHARDKTNETCRN